MKENILVTSEDVDYNKKFCNQANKIYGDKYLFLYFSSAKTVKEYIEESKVNYIISSIKYMESVDDLYSGKIFVLDDKNRDVRIDGRKTYLYKLQNIKKILEQIDENIEKNRDEKSSVLKKKPKLVLFYTINYENKKLDIVRRIAKYLSKKKKVLIMDFDEFRNYRGKTGLSNIIFNYKEGNLTQEMLKKEIDIDKGQDIIKSTTYPEDYNVVTNVDLANIVNEITNLSYDYVLVNADTSYVKNEYIMKDSDLIIFFRNDDKEREDIFKRYLENEVHLDVKKFYELEQDRIDRQYLLSFVKIAFDEKNG